MARKSRKERIVCISLRPDGSLSVEPDSVRVRAGHLVRWVTIVRDAQIEIVFKKRLGSPFAGAFSRPSRGQVLSTPVRDGAAERNQRKKYPYNVVVTLGKYELKVDPDVEVQG